MEVALKRALIALVNAPRLLQAVLAVPPGQGCEQVR